MAWVFEHLQLILVIAGVIAYWINQRAREQAGEDADYDGDGTPERRAPTRDLTPVSRDGVDPEQAERVRRIQEEIRRKIAERRGELAPPPIEPQEAPVFVEREEEVLVPQPPRVPTVSAQERERAFAHDDSAALERQRKLAEQLEELEARRRETRRLAATTFPTARQAVAASREPVAAGARRPVAAELRDPRAVRRVMVLREVLDAPVALR
jgi:hypothetical protein